MKILVVEDDAILLNTLGIMLEEFGYKNIYKTDNSEKALELFQAVKPDLLLLDIHIKGKKDGIEIAEIVSKSSRPVPVIFITSLKAHKYFEKAKKTNPISYILKPFDEDTLRRSIELAIYKFHQVTWDTDLFTNWTEDVIAKDSLFVKQGQRLIKVLILDIISISTDMKYVKLTLQNQSLFIRITLNDLVAKLPAEYFVRVSRSEIINIQYLDNIDLENNRIILKNAQKITVSRRYKEHILKKINIV